MDFWIGQVELLRRTEFDAVRELIASQYRLERRPTTAFTRHWFDTFDWRLYHHGRVLEFDAAPRNAVRLRAIEVPGTGIQAALHAIPSCSADWPPGSLRQSLESLCAERALMEKASCEMWVSSYAIIDAHGKIRAWLEHEQARSKHSTVKRCVRIRALRGYFKTGQRLLRLLEQSMDRQGKGAEPYLCCLRRSGLVPGAYSTRLTLELDSDMHSGEALGSLLLALLDIMEANLDGIRRDIDTEFLHDFRIACRRSRTLLTQVRGVLPAIMLPGFKRTFSWLSRSTGVQRDLDVMLLAFPDFQQMVPASMRPALLPLRQLLEERRAAAHLKLLADLKSRRFRAFLRSWRRLLQRCNNGTAQGVRGRRTLRETSDLTLRRVSRDLAEQGNQVVGGGYSEVTHELRKTGKKLRYLLEAFRSLYPDRDIERVVGRLRKLQNTLGEIVDYHVQSSCLEQCANELELGVDTDAATVFAVRQLAAACARRQAEAEPRFASRYRKYLKSTRSGVFRDIFQESR